MNLIRPTIKGVFAKVEGESSYFRLCLGNGTMFTVGFIRIGGAIFIGIESKSCYTFSHFAHSSYVAEKLKVLEGDAANIADFINNQLECFDTPQGRYFTDCCLKE